MNHLKEQLLSLLLLITAALTLIAFFQIRTKQTPTAPQGINAEVSDTALYSDVIRLHILADSDTKEAQQLKLLVRDALLPYLNALTLPAADKEEAMQTLSLHCEELEQVAKETLLAEHSTCDVTVSLTSCYFPLRIYGSQTYLSEDAILFPPGIYDTINVVIGAGEGHNWWCLAYPSLCFIDASYDYIPKESEEYLHVFSTMKKSSLNRLFYGGFSVSELENEAEEEVSVVLGSRLYEFFLSLFQKE